MELVNPDLTIWQKKDYPEGTVGNKVFPPEMEGRLRLADPLFFPTIRYLVGFKDNNVLVDRDIETVGNLLRCDQDDLKKLLRNNRNYLDKTYTSLQDLLYRFLLSPDDQLMAGVFGRTYRYSESVLIDPSEEGERHQAIQMVLKELQEVKGIGKRGQAVEVLDFRFGLTDWHPKGLEVTGRHFEVSRERIRQIESKALRFIRYPGRSRLLLPYLPEDTQLG